jgi:hypothetical protein
VQVRWAHGLIPYENGQVYATELGVIVQLLLTYFLGGK